jgi:hypothetical protein
MQLFSEISKVPLLLSLLLVVLTDGRARMPDSLYELYDMTIAITLGKKKSTSRARVERLLTLIAFDNHSNIEGADGKPRRLFETGTVKSILSSEPELASVWRDLSTSDDIHIPLVQIVQFDCEEELECVEERGVSVASAGIGGLYQFAHMSLFVKHLVGLYHPTGFPHIIRQQLLNNELLHNAINIASSNTSFCTKFVDGIMRNSTVAVSLTALLRLCQIALGAPNTNLGITLVVGKRNNAWEQVKRLNGPRQSYYTVLAGYRDLTTGKDDGILPEDEVSPAEFELLLSVLENRPGFYRRLRFRLAQLQRIDVESRHAGVSRLRWVATGENVI